jgi:hypothetical protein
MFSFSQMIDASYATDLSSAYGMLTLIGGAIRILNSVRCLHQDQNDDLLGVPGPCINDVLRHL